MVMLLCGCKHTVVYLLTAPGVLYVKIAGIYACCDLLLHHWLMYLPSLKLAADPASGVDRSEVMVDVGIARATLPITSPTSQGSVCYRAMIVDLDVIIITYPAYI